MGGLMIIFCLSILITGVFSRAYVINDNSPIRIVTTSYGQGGRERVDFIFADIHPRHLRPNQRVNFPTSGELERRYQAVRAPGDERGHLVGSQFSGPPTWYNLSPQNARVNRNLGYQALTFDWYSAECEARRFLQRGGNRRVYWRVIMVYIGDSNRPHEYHLSVEFYNNNRVAQMGIDTRLRNPFLREDSTFWICRYCRSSRHDELRRSSRSTDNQCHKIGEKKHFNKN